MSEKLYVLQSDLSNARCGCRATIWQQAEIAADSASIAAELNHRLHIIAAYATSKILTTICFMV